MPRRAKGPRLYLDPERREWVIRDGSYFGRTGCPEQNTQYAEKLLAHYIADKYKPEPSSVPLVADILNVYAKEHLPQTRTLSRSLHNIKNLTATFGPLLVTQVTRTVCQDYAAGRPGPAARRDLEILRAAIGYWHREYGPLAAVPSIPLPDKPEPRERWLTRAEARRFRRAAMTVPHLYRFIVIGLLTGSRSGAIFDLRWSWIDFDGGTMRRRAQGVVQDKQKRTPPLRMGRALQRLLRRWKRMDGDACEYVVHYNGQPVGNIKRTWNKALKTAKLKNVSPHTLRHTRATWLMQAGIDIWEAAGSLGMTPSILQDVYGKHHPDFQKNAAEV